MDLGDKEKYGVSGSVLAEHVSGTAPILDIYLFHLQLANSNYGCINYHGPICALS